MPLVAWRQLDEGLTLLSGTALVWPALCGGALIAFEFARDRARASLVLAAGARGRGCACRWSPTCRAIRSASATTCRWSLPPRLLQRPASASCTGGFSRSWHAGCCSPRCAGQPARSRRAARRANRSAKRSMAGRQAVTDYLHAHYDGTTDHDEHGLARPLHARSVCRASTGTTSCTRATARPGSCDAAPAGRRRWVAIEEQAEGGRCRLSASASADVPRWVRTGSRRRRRSPLSGYAAPAEAERGVGPRERRRWGFRRGEAPRLKSEVEIPARRPATEIDFRCEQTALLRLGVAFGFLPAELDTSRHRVTDREA